MDGARKVRGCQCRTGQPHRYSLCGESQCVSVSSSYVPGGYQDMTCPWVFPHDHQDPQGLTPHGRVRDEVQGPRLSPVLRLYRKAGPNPANQSMQVPTTVRLNGVLRWGGFGDNLGQIDVAPTRDPSRDLSHNPSKTAWSMQVPPCLVRVEKPVSQDVGMT